jgi:hypothetical protein
LSCAFDHSSSFILQPAVCLLTLLTHPPRRTEALAIGNIYTELLGEFGRFVGGSINAVQILKKGVFVSPLELGVNHLEKTLQSLITVLQVRPVLETMA